jgi:predicted O-methyltransferase YrrM
MINNIPGWMMNRDLDILGKLSALCPENSSILEIGSFLGRSTYSLYINKKESVSLTVIDAFEISKDYNTDIETYTYKLDGDLTLALEAAQLSKQQNTWQAGFKKCIGEEIYSNINVSVCKSTSYDKTTDFDLVFIDGGHDRNTVLHDISKFITPTNLLVGDDFGHEFTRFQGLIEAVSASKIKYNRTLVSLDNSRLWMLIPNIGYWKETLKVL